MRGRALWFVFAACGGGEPARDGGAEPADAAADALSDAAFIVTPTAPEAPRFEPCPAGWRAALGACEPLPEIDPSVCQPGEAIFPGSAGCTPVGAPCTADGWPADLPEGGSVRFVAPGGTGPGTRDDPMGSIAEALAVADRDGVVAIARGTYREAVSVPSGRVLWGACAAETRIEAPSPDEGTGTVAIAGQDTVVRNLTIAGDRPAVWVVGARRDVTLEGVVLEGAAFVAWVVADGGAATGRDVVVRDTRSGATGQFGQGINVQDATLDLERAVIEGNRHVAVSATESASVRLADAVIRGTLAEESSGTFGRGLNAQSASTVTLERVVIEGNRELSVFVSGATLEATDLVVRDTTFDEVYESGDGLHVREGSLVELRRARFERNVRVGIAVRGEGATLVLEDAALTDTFAQPDGRYGQALLALDDGARLELHRVVVARSRHVGVSFDGAVDATATDLVIEDTLGQTSDGMFGRGLNAQAGANVLLERARLERNRDVGLFASGEGTRVAGLDLEVWGTEARACAANDCPTDPAGIGAGVYADASISFQRFRIGGSPLCCVQIARDGQADLSDGEIAGCAIGVNLQVEGYDFGRLSDGVAYRDNETNLDSATLPLPPAQEDLDP